VTNERLVTLSMIPSGLLFARIYYIGLRAWLA
jgi:hypothetical protein